MSPSRNVLIAGIFNWTNIRCAKKALVPLRARNLNLVESGVSNQIVILFFVDHVGDHWVDPVRLLYSYSKYLPGSCPKGRESVLRLFFLFQIAIIAKKSKMSQADLYNMRNCRLLHLINPSKDSWLSLKEYRANIYLL